MRQHEHRKAEYMKQRMQLQAQQMAYGGGQAAVGFGASSAPHADGSSQQQQAIPAAAGAWNSGQSSGGDAYASQPANTAQQAGQAQPSGAPSAWNHTSAPNEQTGGYGQQAGYGQPSPYTWDAAQQKWVLSSEIAAAGGTATAGGYATQQTGQGQGGVAAEQYSWDPAQQKWVWGSGSTQQQQQQQQPQTQQPQTQPGWAATAFSNAMPGQASQAQAQPASGGPSQQNAQQQQWVQPGATWDPIKQKWEFTSNAQTGPNWNSDPSNVSQALPPQQQPPQQPLQQPQQQPQYTAQYGQQQVQQTQQGSWPGAYPNALSAAGQAPPTQFAQPAQSGAWGQSQGAHLPAGSWQQGSKDYDPNNPSLTQTSQGYQQQFHTQPQQASATARSPHNPQNRW